MVDTKGVPCLTFEKTPRLGKCDIGPPTVKFPKVPSIRKHGLPGPRTMANLDMLLLPQGRPFCSA
jgi:hypothetical protein